MAFNAAASSFDSLVAEDTPTGNPSGTHPSGVNDATNEQGSEQLLKGLLAAVNKGQEAPAEKTNVVDYSALFGKPAETPTAAPAPAPAPATSAKDDGNPTPPNTTAAKETAPAENAFIKQLNDEGLMTKWVGTQQATPIQLSEDALKAYQDENGEILLTPETLNGVMTHAATAAIQQSASQTISFLRELIPALTETTEARALSAFQAKQNKQTVLSAFEGNVPLQQLAGILVQSGQAANPQEAVKQINALMNAINTEQDKKVNKDKPAEKNIATFLQTV